MHNLLVIFFLFLFVDLRRSAIKVLLLYELLVHVLDVGRALTVTGVVAHVLHLNFVVVIHFQIAA